MKKQYLGISLIERICWIIVIVILFSILLFSKKETITVLKNNCSIWESALQKQAQELEAQINETEHLSLKYKICIEELEENLLSCRNRRLFSVFVASFPENVIANPLKSEIDHSCTDCGYFKGEQEIKINNTCYSAYIYEKNATLQTLPTLKIQWIKQGNDWLYSHCKLCGEEIWCAIK